MLPNDLSRPPPLPPRFPQLRFRGELRPSQAEVVEIARRKFRLGQRRVHIVAPPGSGKTVTGLYLWAECARAPALVLSPNSAIQSQWAARADMFEVVGGSRNNLVSSDARQPGLLTSLTYQSVTLPRGADNDLDGAARGLWSDQLVEKGQAQDPAEAEVWIDDLRAHNPDYYEQRLGAYRKQIRDQAARGGQALKMLHGSSLRALARLRDKGVGLIIFDECHHLMGHWGRVLADAHRLLGEPLVVALTATPPDRAGKPPADIKRYDAFFGPIDYEVPTPAVVKDGFLAPYQDLAYFVRPSADELAYVAGADDQIQILLDELCQPPAPAEVLAETPPEKRAELVATSEAAGHALANQEPPPAAEAAPAGDAPPAAEADAAALPPPLTAAAAKRRHAAERPAPHIEDEAAEPPRDTPPDVDDAAAEGESPADDNPADDNAPSPVASAPEAPAPEETSSPDEAPASEPLPPFEPLPEWLLRVLAERRLPTGVVKDWSSFERRDQQFADAARVFLLQRGVPLPARVPPPDLETPLEEIPPLEVLAPVLDRYIRHRLRRSKNPADHALAARAIRRLRVLGMQVTETGIQACASPVGRVMAYSRSKIDALPAVLRAEHAQLGDKLRAVVVADFEKSSAVSEEVGHVLDKEAGGAAAAFRALVADDVTDLLNPVLVTGSSVLVDDDAAEAFDQAAQDWLRRGGHDVELRFGEQEGFHSVSGKGADWCPRVYVALITELFQRGFTRCLVGTRGLLGEGWDATKINVLIDLTTVTTSMTVNQLRGRSLRLDSHEPDKVANNWDVVCLAPEFSKGLDDYKRFMAKHRVLYGVTDDGAIEKGVGHVHPAFTELRPEGLEGNEGLLNAEMLARSARRPEVRALWRVGEPYQNQPVRVLETRLGKQRAAGGFPPFAGRREAWNARALALAISEAVLAALNEANLTRKILPIHVGELSGGYVRVFLKEATEAENDLFTEAVREALGPLRTPRYVIPREVDYYDDTWLSKLLPSVVGQYFQRRRRQRVMLHAVPAVFAKNKDWVSIYERYWNRYVSPGQAIYAYKEEGQKVVEEALRQGQTPSAEIREKEIYL